VASDGGRLPIGIELMAWALERRLELLDAAITARPTLVSVSFGSPARCVGSLRDAGIVVVSQVQDLSSAIAAAEAWVDFVVAQDTEAGGHTGKVGTLPLLQLLPEVLDVPVVAAGGIASPRGLAAVSAAGAAGALGRHPSAGLPREGRPARGAGEGVGRNRDGHGLHSSLRRRSGPSLARGFCGAGPAHPLHRDRGHREPSWLATLLQPRNWQLPRTAATTTSCV